MNNKHYVITGGTSGLGLSLCKQLLDKGAKITILARDLEKFNEINIYKNNKKVKVIYCDLKDVSDILSIKYKISNKVDGFIYSAGLSHVDRMSHISNEDMKEIYTVNVLHYTILLNVLRPLFTEKPVIVGISSLASFITNIGTGHYGASKAAFTQILNTLRMEEPNYHVLIVSPGVIDTPFLKKSDPKAFYKNNKMVKINPDKLAAKIIKGIDKKKEIINTPQLVYLLLSAYHISPLFIKKRLHKYLA